MPPRLVREKRLGRSRSREHDFFETSSQLLEEWVTNPGVLATFAKHYQTGEPIPPSLIQRLQLTEQFPRGAVVRGEAVRAKLSLSLHDRDPDSVEPNEVYRDIFKAYVPAPFQEGRYFPAGFLQLRNAGGATVYRYLWAEVIVKDLFSHFDRAKLLDPTIARRYKETVLAPGTSKPGAELIEDFLGRPFNGKAREQWLNEGRERRPIKDPQPLGELEERSPDRHPRRVSRRPAHRSGKFCIAETQLDAADDRFTFLRLERCHCLVVCLHRLLPISSSSGDNPASGAALSSVAGAGCRIARRISLRIRFMTA
ncbi:MAG TPA: M3 family metallopeptidase [Burkholderiales bacterium]|nr:M3 family metallopeptidase [Burkholderiales bacterium]